MPDKLTLDELLDQFKAMTLVELHAFVKRFEETFGVSAAFIVPSDAMKGRVVVDPEPEDGEPTELDVVLVSYGDRKIHVIKEVRVLTGLGLKQAKDLVDLAPKPVLTGVSSAVAGVAQRQLEAAGAAVEVRPTGGPPTDHHT